MSMRIVLSDDDDDDVQVPQSSAQSPVLTEKSPVLPGKSPLATHEEVEEKEEGEHGDSEGEGEGENLSDSSEEESDEEMTEADRQFIADDDEMIVKKRKRRERVSDNEDEEGLSEDELDLIHENKNTKVKKLRKKGDSALEAMFDQVLEEHSDDDDDLDEFIVRDEDGEDAVIRRKERVQVKNLGRMSGVSDDSWREMQELFDTSDYDFALDLDDQEFEEEAPKKISIQDVYEPAEIAERMLRPVDDDIRATDVPERFQESLVASSSAIPDDEELGREAALIARQIRKDRDAKLYPLDGLVIPNPEALVLAITHVLKFIRIQVFEVPFIALHRKDYFDGILLPLELWRIQDLNESFLLIEIKKKSIGKLMRDIIKLDESIREDEALRSSIEKVFGPDEAEDVLQYIQVHYADSLAQLNANIEPSGLKKRSTKKIGWKQSIEDAYKYGISEFAKTFNINEELYVTSVITHTPNHFPEDDGGMPLDVADAHVSSKYPTAEKVLEAARFFVAYKIGSQPPLRAFLRRVYTTDAIVSVHLTERGKLEIDVGHKYYYFKYLKDKPVVKFVDGQFLEMVTAENEGLLTITTRVDAEDMLLADMIKNMCNDYVSDHSQAWNEERRLIAETAANLVLFPHCSKWLKERLTTQASDWVSRVCQRSLESKINMAPFRKLEEDGDGPRVVAVSWGDGSKNSLAMAVYLDETGQLSDYVRLERLSDRERGPDVDLLSQFIIDHHPDAIVLGGTKPNTLTILSRNVMPDVLAKARRGGWEGRDAILVDDQVARVFMYSKQGLREFPSADYPLLVPYCVCLGRLVQDPTMAYAALCNTDKDIRHLSLHPFQKYLTEDQIRVFTERSFVNVVNVCGVDINAAVGFPHLSHTLQFVSGVGPRKGRSILTKISKNGGKLQSRNELITMSLVGQRVYMNCASFIRVREVHFKNSFETTLDVLDDTRIHPRDYDLARKMAADALDLDDVVFEEDNPSQHVQELMEGDVDRLNQLLLDDYAVELEKSIKERKRLCLEIIKQELMDPFGDRRRPFEPASVDDIFVMLTGETPETLRVGMTMPAQIVRVKDRFMIVQLPSGIEGNIHFKNLDTYSEDGSLVDLYSAGTSIEVRVLEIVKEKLMVELSGRASDVAPRNMSFGVDVVRDPFFDVKQEIEDIEKNVQIKKKMARAVRVIKHSYFQNLDYKGACAYLEGKTRGELVVRPSTKGSDHISITWKVDEGVYQHIDVLELQKENEWSLGRILQIDGKRFEEIDEIIVGYIEPMVRRVTMMLQHPKFQRKSMEDMKSYLVQHSEAFKQSSYGFILAPTKPGCFYLVYKHANTEAKHDLITIKPNGFEFRKKLVQSINDLLNYFKTDEGKRASEKSVPVDPRRQAYPAYPPPREYMQPPPRDPYMRPPMPPQMGYYPPQARYQPPPRRS